MHANALSAALAMGAPRHPHHARYDRAPWYRGSLDGKSDALTIAAAQAKRARKNALRLALVARGALLPVEA